nr:hypothetical protein [uncultured Methanospirillum sp.]
MGDIVESLWISVLASIIAAFFTAHYTQNEMRRRDFNKHIKILFKEINENENKLNLFLNHLQEKTVVWEEKKRDYQSLSPDWRGIWLDKKISSGFPPFVFNYLSFDNYNLFYNLGYQLELPDEGEKLNGSYTFLKKFCQNTQELEQLINSKVKKGEDFSQYIELMKSEYNLICNYIPEIKTEYGNSGEKIFKSYWGYHKKNLINFLREYFFSDHQIKSKNNQTPIDTANPIIEEPSSNQAQDINVPPKNKFYPESEGSIPVYNDKMIEVASTSMERTIRYSKDDPQSFPTTTNESNMTDILQKDQKYTPVYRNKRK